MRTLCHGTLVYSTDITVIRQKLLEVLYQYDPITAVCMSTNPVTDEHTIADIFEALAEYVPEDHYIGVSDSDPADIGVHPWPEGE